MSTTETEKDSETEIISESLKKYAEFRPSVVQSTIWSKKFVLFVENLSVSFDGFKAVDIPQYGIEHGELRVIIGPNGAGKTPSVIWLVEKRSLQPVGFILTEKKK